MAADLVTGLLADWEVGTANTDLSGNGRDLTTVGSLTRSGGWLIGPNGSNYLKIDNPTWLDGRGVRTILIAARSSSRSGNRCTVSHGGATAGTTTNIYIWDAAGLVVYSNGAVRHTPGGNNPPTNGRAAVVAWWQASTSENRYSINNSAASAFNSGNCTVVNPCPALMIGNWPTQPAIGDIKRVSIYDRVLTDEDINAWYDREHEDRTVYVDPNATGANTGVSAANAYTALTSAATDLLSHDFLKLNASASAPFAGGQTFTGLWRLDVAADEGADAAYNATNGRLSTSWTGPTAGVFQLTLAAKPSHVVYDWKQDNNGDVTGWVYDDWDTYLMDRWDIPTVDRQPFYGFLEEDTSTPTTPAEGKWGHAAGVLYLNPPGAPDLATVKLLARYCPSGLHGLGFVGCRELNISGRTRFNLFPSAAGSEYAIFTNGEDMNVRDAIIHYGGYHGAGAAGASPPGGPNNTLQNIIVVGGTGDEAGSGALNGVVVYQPSTASEFGGHLIEDHALIASPRFLYTGAPASTNWTANPCLAHSDGGVTTMTATWRRILCLDKVDALEIEHSITNTLTGYSTLGQGTIGDPFDYDTYPQKIEDSYFRGRIVPAATGLTAYRNTMFDRYQCGRTALAAVTGSGITAAESHGYFDGCFFLLGLHANAFFESWAAIDSLVFNECCFLFMSETAKACFLSIRSAGTGTNRFRFQSCYFDSVDASLTHGLLHSSASDTPWNAHFNDVSSDGRNVFGPNIVMAWNAAKSSSRDIGWWKANVEGGATDTQRPLKWGSTTAAKVNYLRRYWATGSPGPVPVYLNKGANRKGAR